MDFDELIRRIRNGSAEAEAELIAFYGRGVAILLRRRTNDAGAAEDLSQETFRVAIEKIRAGDVRDPRRLSGFICAIARNMAILHFRREGRRRRETDIDEAHSLSDPGPRPVDRLLAREQALLVREVLEELPQERDRQVLIRFYLGDEDKEQIRRDLRLSPLHFNRVLYRARQRFRRLYEQRNLRERKDLGAGVAKTEG